MTLEARTFWKVTCDFSGCSRKQTVNVMTRGHAERILKKAGWRLGPNCRCPDHTGGLL